MSNKSFSASVTDWSDKVKRMNDEIVRESARLLLAELVRNMPHETGNLARSVKVTLNGIVPVDRDPDKIYTDLSGANAATLLQVEAGQNVYVSIPAPYAKRVNYGQSSTDGAGRYFNQAGSFFFEITASKWQTIVNQAVANVKAKHG